MNKPVPFSVTEESFSECWVHVDKLRRTARVKAVISKIGGFVINLFFLLSLIFSACGLLCERLSGSFPDFWEAFFLFSLWEQVAGFLLTPGAALSEDIGRLLMAAYVVSAAAFCLLALLIGLVYHPRKEMLPTGTYEENTLLLAKKAREA